MGTHAGFISYVCHGKEWLRKSCVIISVFPGVMLTGDESPAFQGKETFGLNSYPTRGDTDCASDLLGVLEWQSSRKVYIFLDSNSHGFLILMNQNILSITWLLHMLPYFHIASLLQ